MANQIESYIRALKHQLWLRGMYDPEILAEIENHLLESVDAGVRRGWSVEDSERQALEYFGSIQKVTRAFEKERNHIMQNLLVMVAVMAGLFSVYVDSRPSWDDTGILAGGLLLISGLLTMLGHRRPWLIALAVGLWIPLRGVFVTHNYGSILALVFALAGAYAGWLFRLGFQKMFHPA